MELLWSVAINPHLTVGLLLLKHGESLVRLPSGTSLREALVKVLEINPLHSFPSIVAVHHLLQWSGQYGFLPISPPFVSVRCEDSNILMKLFSLSSPFFIHWQRNLYCDSSKLTLIMTSDTSSDGPDHQNFFITFSANKISRLLNEF